MGRDVVRLGVLVIVVIKLLAPVRRDLTAEERTEAAPLHVGRSRDAGHVEEGLGEVDVRDEGLVDRTRGGDAGPAHEERRADGLLEDPALIEPAMLAEVEALVGRVDDDGVREQALLLEVLQDAADVVVDRLHAAEVIVHVALVAPLDQVATLGLRPLVGLVDRTIVGVPDLGLLGRDAGRVDELHVERVDGLGQGHVLVADRVGAIGVVIEQRVRLGVDTSLVPPEVREIGRPFAVRGLLLAHQQEGLGLVALGQPAEGDVGGDIRHVTRSLHDAGGRLHGRVVIDTLPQEDLPEVETGRVGVEVPLADHRGLVTGGLQEFRERRLGPVEDGVGVVVETVPVGILAGQDHRAARAADGVRDQRPVEAHAFPGDPVDIRGLDEFPLVAVGADGLVGMVIGVDEDDVRASRFGGGQEAADQTEKGCQDSHGVYDDI